ncbi:MAG: NfeD family protein [Pseudomonadota bacterium]
MDFIFSSVTIWHWLVLGLVLVGIEMMTGTFDLLFVALAAFTTAAFTALMPDVASGWQMQAAVFAITAVSLIVLGRTVFAGMRRVIGEHPTLNRRMDSLIGQHGTVTTPFTDGQGRVKIGDSEWMATSLGASDMATGVSIIVEETEKTRVFVRPL